MEKIRYYLQYDSKRDAIAGRAYEHVLQDHTWRQRFQAVFARLDDRPARPPRGCRKYRVMVLAGEGARHRITVDDRRLELCFADPESDWKAAAPGMDGIIWLEQDSTLNNESLYMMAFGLVADKSDMIAANFYTGSRNRRYWIRFGSSVVEQRREMLRMLPLSCQMFSGSYAAGHGCELISDTGRQKVSYIEYPSFWIRLPYFRSRRLRLYFADHGDSRQRFRAHIRSLQPGQALSLAADKIWQRVIQNRIRI